MKNNVSIKGNYYCRWTWFETWCHLARPWMRGPSSTKVKLELNVLIPWVAGSLGLVWVQGMVFVLAWFCGASLKLVSLSVVLGLGEWRVQLANQSWGFEVWVPLVCVVLFCTPTSHGSVELMLVKWQGDIRVRPGYLSLIMCSYLHLS